MVDEIVREEKKIIGNYKAKFKTSFNKKKSDFIFLNVSISEDLRNLIKEIVIINEETEFTFYNGEQEDKYKRYLVKKWVYSALYGSYKDFLFEKNLIDKNELKVKLIDVKRIDSLIEDFKENFRRFIEVVLKYSKIDVNVSFNISK